MQKNHNFDYLNGVAVQYPGSKYHEQINRVSNDLEGPHVYEEDEEDRKLRFSGFYNDEL